jgi:methylmalonic aciduria homocystinuria type C protein
MSRALYTRIVQRLAERGLDLCCPFAVKNSAEFGLDFECFDLPEALGIVVGNTQAVWPHFNAFRQRAPNVAHPLHLFIEQSIAEATVHAHRELDVTSPHRVYYSHRHDYPRSSGARGPIPMQRIASRAALAVLGPANLNVHVEYGPWISLRALIVLGCAPSDDLPHPAPAAEEPCKSCAERPCVPALESALAHELGNAEPRWRRWLAVRDACPVGREHRFCDEQIAFHYASLGAPKPGRGA